MAECKSMEGAMSISSAYATSFGALPSGTVYMKAMEGIDLRPKLNEVAQVGMKALTAGGNLYASTTHYSGTAGSIPSMVPIYVDPRVVDTTRKFTPFVELVPRVTNMGLTADYNQITGKGGGFVAAEDAVLVETNTTYTRQSTPIKYLYAVGRVTGQAVAAIPSYILQGMVPQGGATGGFNDMTGTNAKQMEILVKTREMRELEENLIIGGDAGTYPNQFSGIVTLMSTTNTVAKGTTAMTLADINTAIQYAFDHSGRPNLAVCSSGVYTDLLGLLTAKIGYLQPTQQVFWGFSTIVLNTMVGQIPVIPSQYMSNVSGSKAIYFLDMSVVEMRVLQDLTYEELAKTNDSEKFMLKLYETFIIKNTSFCSSITGISG